MQRLKKLYRLIPAAILCGIVSTTPAYNEEASLKEKPKEQILSPETQELLQKAREETLAIKTSEIEDIVKNENPYALLLYGTQFYEAPQPPKLPKPFGYGGLDGLVGYGNYKIGLIGFERVSQNADAEIHFGEIKEGHLAEITAKKGKIAITPREYRGVFLPPLEKLNWQDKILFNIGIFNPDSYQDNPEFIYDNGKNLYIKGRLDMSPFIGERELNILAKSLGLTDLLEEELPLRQKNDK